MCTLRSALKQCVKDIDLYTPSTKLGTYVPAQSTNIDLQQRHLMELNCLPTCAFIMYDTFSGSPKWSHMPLYMYMCICIGSRFTTCRCHYRGRELRCRCRFCRICTTLLYINRTGTLGTQAVLNIDVYLRIEVNS